MFSPSHLCVPVSVLLALGPACHLSPWPLRDEPSAPLPADDQGPRVRHLDQDGNDSWDQAAAFSAAAGAAVVLEGELGAVDPEGVLDQVDYYRLQARHRALLVLVTGGVGVDLVTADDREVPGALPSAIWLDDLSVDGGYALRVQPLATGVVPYALTVAAGAHERAPCEETCRFGLRCVDGHCAQGAGTDEGCLHHGDCADGDCRDGRCAAGEASCQAAQDLDGCQPCDWDSDCALGHCHYGTCMVDEWSCEQAGADSGRRCRGGRVQWCVAGQWSDAGRCDTGCLHDQCAPLPDRCQVEGAVICMDQYEAICRDGEWKLGFPSSGSCGLGAGLEGERCSSDLDCMAPLACMPTGLDPAIGDGVCALPCAELGTACHDGKVCGALLDGRLFCLQVDLYGGCDLDALRGCRGAVAGACVEGTCWPSCEVSTCPGAACPCSAGVSCLPLAASGAGAGVGLCLAFAQVGEVCGGERLCDDGAVCVAEAEGDTSGVCRALCEGSCPGGQECLPLTNDLWACFPA